MKKIQPSKKISNLGIDLNFNRCGKALLEIVTKPCFENENQVISFLKFIKKTLSFYKISEAKFENGTLRADVNISIYDKNFSTNRVEIKNLNSFSNIKKAIKIEYENQLNNFLIKKKKNNIVTKNFNEKLNNLVFLRKKENNFDYYFIREPNIPKIIFSKKNKNNLLKLNFNKYKDFYYFCFKNVSKEIFNSFFYTEDNLQIFSYLFSAYNLYKINYSYWKFVFGYLIKKYKNKKINNNIKILNFLLKTISNKIISKQILNNFFLLKILFWC